MNRKTVAVIFGGVSSEHEVSLMSASSVLQNIPKDRYDVVMLGITGEGQWLMYTGDPAMLPGGAWLKDTGHLTPAVISPDRGVHGILVLEGDRYSTVWIDVAFPVLHGKNGEDGTIQGLFEIAGIPYVGCSVIASAMCMDKTVTHMVLDNADIPTAKWEQVHISEMENYTAVSERLGNALGYPMFVKPVNAGSSVGVSKVSAPQELRAALDKAFKEDTRVLAEVMITGAEVECAVLGNQSPLAAPVLGELVPQAEFYDYNAKYIDGTTVLHLPARISDDTAKLIRETAVRAYRAMGCTGLARVDFFACGDGSIILNEINTLPGFTSISMYPKMWAQSGKEYSKLIAELIEYALK